MKLGILRETKNPPDRRVPFDPQQCKELIDTYPELDLVVQPSDYRCFSDAEYEAAGITLQEKVNDCDVLMGVKEVKTEALIPDKTYVFFSHTAKEQPYNRALLQEILKRGITLLDYEYFTRKDKSRVVAFGRWAGIVGAYNGLMAYGKRMGLYELKQAHELSGLTEMKALVAGLDLKGARIVLSGGGRVAGGAVEVLEAAGIQEVSPGKYLSKSVEGAQFCRLDPWYYTERVDGGAFDFDHFVANPGAYKNTFVPFAMASNMYIACHFWDPNSPKLLELKDLQTEGFPLQVIADISCDIDGPIASTVRASTIAEPVYGFHAPSAQEREDAFAMENITVMAVDNLPGELPRDASTSFGKALLENLIPYLMDEDTEGIIERAKITTGGRLSPLYEYLKDFVE